MSAGGFHKTPQGRARDRKAQKAQKATDAILKAIFGNLSEAIKAGKKEEERIKKERAKARAKGKSKKKGLFGF